MKPEIPKSAQAALAQQSAADEHPSADLLNGFVEQALTPPEKDRVTTHLAACADCREVVFLASGVQPEIPAIQEHAAARPVEPRRGWSGWKWFVPALATIVIVSGVIVERHRLFPPAQPSTTEVATVARTGEPAAQPPQAADKETPSSQPMPRSTPPPPQATSDEKIAASRSDLSKDAVGAARRSTPAEATNSAPAGMVTQAETYKKNEEAYALKAAKPGAQQMGGPVAPKQAPTQQSQQQLASAAPPEVSSAAPAMAKSAGALAKAKSAQSVAESKPAMAADHAALDAARTDPNAQPDVAKGTPSAPNRDYDTTSMSSDLLQNAPNGGNDITYVAPAAHKAVPPSHWRITNDGQLQRQIGAGSWTRALADQPITLHTLAVVGDQVWTGGSDGALFHSIDGGGQWSKVGLSSGGQLEHGTLVSIRFNTALQGTVTTDTGATWSTLDGGRTWTKQ